MEYVIADKNKAEEMGFMPFAHRCTKDKMVLNAIEINGIETSGKSVEAKADALGWEYCENENDVFNKLKKYE